MACLIRAETHWITEINARSNPYSKSHSRRLKRAARPEANLVTSLNDFQDVLPEIEPEFDDSHSAQDEDEEAAMIDDDEHAKPGTGGKGKEKLTAKKRQRVLQVV